MTVGHIAAIDIGATKTLLAIRSVSQLEDGWAPGSPLERIESDLEPEAFVGWVTSEIRRALVGRSGRIAAVGVAAPGPLDATRGVITRSSNLGWDDVPIAEMLGERLQAPVALEDDANTAALGEWHFGAGRGADPMGYLTVSSGIGGGLVAAGCSIRGAAGNAGEVGHIVIDPSGPRCACGRRGDVESYAGGAALARRARRVWPRRTLPDGRPAPRDAADVFRLAREGDVDAGRLVDDAAGALATALAAMAAVVEPAVIVVGGSIGLGQRQFIRRATTLARRRVLRENGDSLRVAPAALGHESVLAGAADLALRLVGSR
jgi:glucokinase